MAKMKRKGDLPVKTCVTCGRPMVWRKAWEKVWDEVKYCSERCRRQKGGNAALQADQSAPTMRANLPKV